MKNKFIIKEKKTKQQKLLRFMKCCLIFIVLGIGSCFANSTYSQKTFFTFEYNNRTVKEIIHEIEQSSEYIFFYLDNSVDLTRRVSVKVENEQVEKVLDQLFKGTRNQYYISDRQIIISSTNAPGPASIAPVIQQQGRTITGVVRDAFGPVIGANVIVKGTTNGAVTDIDGQFTLSNVPANAVLQVSFIGYISQEVNAENQTQFDIMMIEDVGTLEEVVVVGYGTQVRRDISSSVTTVSAEDLKEIPVMTIAEALMGQAAGLYISSTGAPGSATTIRVRGIGSVSGGAGPLVIVDGIANVDINSINPNDIENISLLKDASATAIYGARGANGVMLITTKQGSRDGRIRITYDGYVGLSTMANNGFDVLNGWEFMDFLAEGMVNQREIRKTVPGTHAQFGSLDANDQLKMPYATKPAGMSRDQVIQQWGSIDNWVASYRSDGTNSWARSAYYQMLEDGYSEADARKGTDWYNLLVQTGLIQNHNLSLQGGNGDKGMYSINLGVSQQEGTVKSSFSNRYTLRTNAVFNPSKYLSFGFNFNVSAGESGGDRGSNSETSVFGLVYQSQSWIPVYNVGGEYAGSQSPEGGRIATPIATAYMQTLSSSRNLREQAGLYAELKPITGLTFKTQYAPSINGSWSTDFSPIDVIWNIRGNSFNSYSETSSYDFTWQWTNTVNYITNIYVNHSIDITFGTEAIDDNRIGRTQTGTRQDYTFEKDPNTWTLNNGSSANMTNSGTASTRTSFFGYFGRLVYNYKGTYIVNAAFRRDASSRFAERNRWGTFPSISAAWRVSDEVFMQSTKSFIDDFKFRIGYGKTGNAAGNAYNWAFQYGTSNSHLYDVGGANNSGWTGFGATALGDLNAKWETVNTLNIGVDVTALKQRLTASFEWYTRQTSDMLVSADWSAMAGGATRPRINIGDMSNKGVDLTVAWRERKRMFSYNISANLSTYRNKVTRLGSADIFNNTRLNNVNITTEGQPIGMFYGYKVIGIYNNEEDVLNYKSNGQTVLPFGAASLETLNPTNYVGRYKLADTDGDGDVDELDRTIIGNPHPDFTGGLNANVTYRNFDLSTQFYFSVGNDLYKHYMYFTHYGALQANYTKDRRDNSWHPAKNPDGIYPLWLTTNNEGAEAASNSNSMYVEDGSYLRMRTLTLGYSLPRNIARSTGLERVRFYAQVTNLFTLTKYAGLEPEVRTSSDTNRGIDYGSYGQPRQYIFGVNISFQ